MVVCEFRILEDGKYLCQNKMGFDYSNWDCDNCIDDNGDE